MKRGSTSRAIHKEDYGPGGVTTTQTLPLAHCVSLLPPSESIRVFDTEGKRTLIEVTRGRSKQSRVEKLHLSARDGPSVERNGTEAVEQRLKIWRRESGRSACFVLCQKDVPSAFEP